MRRIRILWGVMSKEFAIAWEYVPLLSVSTIISCYASFFSVVYTVGAKTNKVFITSFANEYIVVADRLHVDLRTRQESFDAEYLSLIHI